MKQTMPWRAIVVTIGAALLACLAGCKATDSGKPSKPDAALTSFSYGDWAKFLGAVATPDGYVQWDVLQNEKNDARADLMKFIGELGAASPDNRRDLFPTENDALAYWINAHNALAIYAVIQRKYPASVEGIGADKFVVAGQTLSLDEIATKKVDAATHPRRYFVLNDCAHSSPPLRGSPYDGAVLDAQIEDQTRLYLRDPRAAGRMMDTVILSAFIYQHEMQLVAEMNKGAPRQIGLLEVLQKLAPPDSPINGAKTVASMEFDWSLNRPPR